MKRILLIATGGTIASVASDDGLKPGLTPEELCRSIPGADSLCQLDSVQLLNTDSTNIQPEHWLMIARAVEENYADYDGFVITHGTDTMAYTAAALSYLIQDSQKPILLTGSQKTLDDAFSDVRKNLADSVRFACEGGMAGVFVVFCSQVILGTRVRKTKTRSVQAFDSINYPVLAFVDGSVIVKYIDMPPNGNAVRFYRALKPKVFLLKLIPGIAPDILDYVGEHYDAVVIESYGMGGIPFGNKQNFLEKLEGLVRRGCVVVIATQVMLEGSNASLYEVGLRAMNLYPLLQSYDMTIEAAVTKLMWLLGEMEDMDAVRRGFYVPVARDLLVVGSTTKD